MASDTFHDDPAGFGAAVENLKAENQRLRSALRRIERETQRGWLSVRAFQNAVVRELVDAGIKPGCNAHCAPDCDGKQPTK